MALILNLETTTTNCSVSLANNEELIAIEEENKNNFSHAERLHVFINEVLKSSKIDRSQLDAIAVSKGPGSYTGLRIGVSAAKGLCFALNIPLIAVDTLRALAMQVVPSSSNTIIIPMLDARRQEVYTATYNSNYECITAANAKIIEQDSFDHLVKEHKVIYIGSGASKTKEITANSSANYLEDAVPSAKEMAQLSYAKYKISDIEDVAYFEPYYLKDFIAK